MRELKFTCYCHPEPQGSSRGFPIRRANGAIGVSITSDNSKLKPFRHAVTCTAIEAVREYDRAWVGAFAAKGVPVAMEIRCYFQKPASVSKKREYPVVKPDIDKLARAILDALTGVCYVDDAQVIELSIQKLYGTPERVEIDIATVD